MQASPILRHPVALGLLVVACLAHAACHAPRTSAPQTGPAVAFPADDAVPADHELTEPQAIEVLWKERMGQGYVYVEHRGDYRGYAAPLAGLLEATESELGTPVVGAPFLLLFDDPGTVPVEQLRARICLPVDAPPTDGSSDRIRFDVLPSAMVVYASVPARAPEAMRSVPALFRSMRSLGGSPAGPIREVLLDADPRSGRPRTEVQIPWTRAGT